eukprot:gene23027-biopygen8387
MLERVVHSDLIKSPDHGFMLRESENSDGTNPTLGVENLTE